MTDEERTDELTQKAKESYKIYSEDNCVDTYKGYQYIDGYCNGYEQGYEDCRHYAHDYYISEIKELKERCKAWEVAFKNLDHLYHEVNEEKCKFEIENKSLITRNHIVPEHYLSEAIDRCNELEKQIENMKCCGNCSNYYLGEDKFYRCKVGSFFISCNSKSCKDWSSL